MSRAFLWKNVINTKKITRIVIFPNKLVAKVKINRTFVKLQNSSWQLENRLYYLTVDVDDWIITNNVGLMSQIILLLVDICKDY